jgi:predicted dehydrogenase
MANKTTKIVGIVGLGSMGQRYASYLKGCKDTIVIGCDVRPEAHTDDYVCVDSVENLLNTVEPDVMIIASPAEHHLEILYTVHDAVPSCSILIEKPLTNRRLELEDFERCRAFGGSLIAVGYCWRFHPYTNHLRRVRNGIRNITLYSGSDMRTWPGHHYADPLREFSHELDLVVYLTKRITLGSAALSPSGLYVMNGEHAQGKWEVRIAPFVKDYGRWIKVDMHDKSSVTYHWDVTKETIDVMYKKQANQLVHASRVSHLLCPLLSGLETTLLVDEIDARIEGQETWLPKRPM